MVERLTDQGVGKMKDHFMISESDGGLYDTRLANWSAKPIRANYARHFMDIKNVSQMKASIRAGQYVFPGGYELFFIASDGGSICFDCARKEFRNIADSIRNNISDGWKIVACDNAEYYEDGLNCDHCNKVLNEEESV
jgi:hypothetical protein